MELPKFEEATLLKRYKRFLADVETITGEIQTVYCPNTGAMSGCSDPYSKVWLSFSDSKTRKYPKTLEFVETSGDLIGVRSVFANSLVCEALVGGVIEGLGNPKLLQSEPKIPDENGRFDFLYISKSGVVSIEVKSVSWLLNDGRGVFPDSVSSRALRHLKALSRRIEIGERAMLVFCAQHTGIRSIRSAREIDPRYSDELALSIENGLEVIALGCTNDLVTYKADRVIPFLIG